MFTGWLFLGKRSGGQEILGACIIFIGAFIVPLPQLMAPTDGAQEEQHGRASSNTHLLKSGGGVLFAVLLYAFSNVPKAMASVYKELGMGDMKVNVIYLTQWVSVYQLLWGLCLMPVQVRV